MRMPLLPPDLMQSPAEPKFEVGPRPMAPLLEITKTFPPEGVPTWIAEPGPPVAFLRILRPTLAVRVQVWLICWPVTSVGAAWAGWHRKTASTRALTAV